MDSQNNLPPLVRIMLEDIKREEIVAQADEEGSELQDAIVNNPEKFPEALDGLLAKTKDIAVEELGLPQNKAQITSEEAERFASIFKELLNWRTLLIFVDGEPDNDIDRIVSQIFEEGSEENREGLEEAIERPLDPTNDVEGMMAGLKRAFPQLARDNSGTYMEVTEALSAHKNIFEGLYIPLLDLIVSITETSTEEECNVGSPGRKISWIEDQYDYDLHPVIDDRFRKLRNAEAHNSYTYGGLSSNSNKIKIKDPDGEVEMELTKDELMEIVELQLRVIVESLKSLNKSFNQEFIE